MLNVRNETRLTAAGDKTYRQIRQQNVGVFCQLIVGTQTKLSIQSVNPLNNKKKAMEEGHWGRGQYRFAERATDNTLEQVNRVLITIMPSYLALVGRFHSLMQVGEILASQSVSQLVNQIS